MTNHITEVLFKYLDIIPIILSGLVLLYISYIVSNVTGNLVKRLLPGGMANELKSFIPKTVKVFAFALGLGITLKIMGVETGSLLTMMGLSSVAIGLSLKDIFVNTIQGVMILINHTFSVGDEISIKDVSGKVIKVDLLHTKIDSGDEIRFIPNSIMFSEIVSVKKN